MEVYTIFTLRKVQSEIDSLILPNPVSQSLNPKSKHYEFVKDKLAKLIIKTQKRALKKELKRKVKAEKKKSEQ